MVVVPQAMVNTSRRVRQSIATRMNALWSNVDHEAIGRRDQKNGEPQLLQKFLTITETLLLQLAMSFFFR